MTSTVRAPRPAPRRAAPAPVDRRAHLRVVPPPSRPDLRRRRTGAALAVAMVVVFGSLLVSAVFHGALVSGQSHLDDVDRELVEVRAELARERLALADLQAPGRIAAEAEELGMVRSEEQTWLSPGTGAGPVVTGDPTVADPALDGADPSTDTTADPDGTGVEPDPATSASGTSELASGSPVR